MMMMMTKIRMEDLTLEEREFVISQSGDNTSVFYIYTDNPVWINRLKKLGIEEDKERKSGDGIGKYYILPSNQLTIRKRRELTAEELQKKREQIAKNMGRQRRGEDVDPVDWKPDISDDYGQPV